MSVSYIITNPAIYICLKIFELTAKSSAGWSLNFIFFYKGWSLEKCQQLDVYPLMSGFVVWVQFLCHSHSFISHWTCRDVTLLLISWLFISVQSHPLLYSLNFCFFFGFFCDSSIPLKFKLCLGFSVCRLFDKKLSMKKKLQSVFILWTEYSLIFWLWNHHLITQIVIMVSPGHWKLFLGQMSLRKLKLMKNETAQE